MSDLIDRQDAIDAIVKQSVVDKTVAKRVLAQLPFAEPEIVRCKDCKHRPIDTGKDNDPEDFEFPDDICPCACTDYFYSWMPDDDWFCANGGRTDGEQE